MVVVKGKVLRAGKPKAYRYGRGVVYKFFVEAETDTAGVVKAMVEVTGDRETVYPGDIVEMESKEIKDGWMSVTANRNYKVLEQRGKEDWEKGKQAWIAEKKAERRTQFDILRYEEHAQSKSRMDFGKQISEELGLGRTPTVAIKVTTVLRWLKRKNTDKEGIGGERGMYGGYGHPGTGMRAPSGPLYNEPTSIRSAVLDEGVRSGLWTKDARGFYTITEHGKQEMAKIDRLDTEDKTIRLYKYQAQVVGFRIASESRVHPDFKSLKEEDVFQKIIAYESDERESEIKKIHTIAKQHAEAFAGCKPVYEYELRYDCTPEQQRVVDNIMWNWHEALKGGIKDAFR